MSRICLEGFYSYCFSDIWFSLLVSDERVHRTYHRVQGNQAFSVQRLSIKNWIEKRQHEGESYLADCQRLHEFPRD